MAKPPAPLKIVRLPNGRRRRRDRQVPLKKAA